MLEVINWISEYRQIIMPVMGAIMGSLVVFAYKYTTIKVEDK